MSIVIWILTFFLILTSIFLVLIVLAQKAKSDGGIGAAMGGGVTEATFGAETSNVLSKMTIYSSITFFVLSLVLYLTRLHQYKHGVMGGSLPEIQAPALPPATATPAPAAGLTVPTTPAPVTGALAVPSAPTPAAPGTAAPTPEPVKP